MLFVVQWVDVLFCKTCFLHTGPALAYFRVPLYVVIIKVNRVLTRPQYSYMDRVDRQVFCHLDLGLNLSRPRRYCSNTTTPKELYYTIEIAAAQLLYDISATVVVSGTAAFPPVPSPPLINSLYGIYHLHAIHHSTVAPD